MAKTNCEQCDSEISNGDGSNLLFYKNEDSTNENEEGHEVWICWKCKAIGIEDNDNNIIWYTQFIRID